MKTVVAAAVVALAWSDETSLMQERVTRSTSGKLSASADTTTSRKESGTKLIETAVNMIKNGVTPDVIQFVDETIEEITEDVLVAIQSEHDNDQAYIDQLCADFLLAVERLETHANEIEQHDENRVAASTAHMECRAEEAYLCAQSRRCETQLRHLWDIVRREEQTMREIHDSIHDEWCVHPPYFPNPWPAISVWLSHPFNWADTSPYPHLTIPSDVVDFRTVSVTTFNSYMEQKLIVEESWRTYNEKLIVCAGLEEQWELHIPECDQAQTTLREHACEHAIANRQARETFGREWDRITRLFEQARAAKTANERDRKEEWETLKIVQCLLNHVHEAVVANLETGAPCPTIDSDPDGVTLAIEDCHIVERGCGPESLTAHLCLRWCEVPTVPPLPPVEEPACTPAYVAKEQAQFLETIQVAYNGRLTSNAEYPSDPLTDYNTALSEAGWAGCAPPLVCIDCAGAEVQEPCLEHTGGAHVCHLHEQYLSPGQSNADTFKCLDGNCILQAGRCNSISNCDDGSDEQGCSDEDNIFVPAYLAQSFTCPDDFHNDVHFRCANNQCIEKVGLCNGVENCADGSDEAHCSRTLEVTVEATSGRTITTESLESHTGVFHDRDYSFDSLGDFAGKTFIKYSNDDKVTDHLHVMTKLRTLEPTTVYVVKLAGKSIPWLEAQHYTHRTDVSGVTFSGIHADTNRGFIRHKEWDTSLITTDHFAASDVYSKDFPAGTISIPGNDGGDGSFLIFLEKASMPSEPLELVCTGWPAAPADLRRDGSQRERCEFGNNLNDGFQYVYNEGRGQESAVCGQTANCWCCRAPL